MLFWETTKVVVKTIDCTTVLRQRQLPVTEHTDIIGDKFWLEHPHLLA